MSRFIEKLKQASLAAPQQMGFRASTATSSKPRMILVASLPEATRGGNSADYVAGADAGLLCITKLSSGVKALEKISKAVPEIPWGGWVKNISSEEIKLLVEAGADFVLFPSTSSIDVAQKEGVGRILEVEASIGEGLLRAIDRLPVDAVLMGSEEGEGITWHQLMRYHRYTSLLSKPLLVSVTLQVTGNELQALGEAGVDGVLVEMDAEQPAGRVNELRQAMDKLTFPSRHKQQRIGVLLPRVSPAGGETAEEEEEEEEEGE